MKLGFIGLGLMGEPMAGHLLKAGHSVTVWNRTAEKAEALGQAGASVAGSPQEVAGASEITVVMVTDSPDVEEVVLGDRGVIHGAQPGSAVVDMSTISPSVTRSLAARLEEKGVGMLDAPVSGGTWGAQNASLSIMVGGPRELYDRCLPVFEAMGQRITYCGGTGMGAGDQAGEPDHRGRNAGGGLRGAGLRCEGGGGPGGGVPGGHRRRCQLVAAGEPGRPPPQGRLRPRFQGAPAGEGPAPHRRGGQGDAAPAPDHAPW